MKPTDFNAFSAIWARCWEALGRAISGQGIRFAFDALSHYDLEDIARALNLHARNPDSGQYPPKPADVVRILEGDTETRAMRAWVAVERALRSIGSYSSVVFDDPITQGVISEMGGWIKLCEVTEDELPFRRNEFVKRYRGYASQSKAPEFPKVLIGIADAHNAVAGHARRDVVAIGDRTKAALVYRQGGQTAVKSTPMVLAGDKALKAIPAKGDSDGDAR